MRVDGKWTKVNQKRPLIRCRVSKRHRMKGREERYENITNSQRKTL